MINPRELRIGNLVQIIGSETDYNEFDGDFYDDQINPIPLTEEWVIKLGFKKQEYHLDWMEMPYRHSVIKAFGLNTNWAHGKMIGYNVCVKGIGWTNVQFNKLEFVHQLQNLYFALTGEELTIQK